MKIIGICGSPRKGNTEFLLREALKAARKKGAETELILLRKKKIKFCKGCDDICSKTHRCVIRDDMDEIYEKIKSANVLIIGTPTYFDNVSGIMKNFIDRTDPLCGQIKNKNVGLVITGGAPSSILEKTSLRIMKNFCKIHGMKVKWTLSIKAYKKCEVNKNKKAIEKARKLGERLAEQ